MNRQVSPLYPYLAEIEDPRKPKGIRHALAAILSLCVVALMCGAKNPNRIANWWKNRTGLDSLLERLGFTQDYGPGKSTVYRVLSEAIVEQLQCKISEWVEANFAGILLPDDEELSHAAEPTYAIILGAKKASHIGPRK